ncbi:10765_t:CDS:2, partial [Gigaspora margarita]
QPQLFTSGDLVFISGKYVIENLEQCITISYTSIINNKNPNQSVEYNSITGSSDVKMQITVLYSSQATRFQKYLGTSGSNIKLENMYFASGLFKFSKSGQIIIKATDIDYLKTLTLNYNTFKNSSLINSRNRSIINIIADDIKSVSAQIPLKHADLLLIQTNCIKTGSSSKENEKNDKNDRPDFENEDELDNDTCIENKEYKEDLQPKN